MIPSSSAIAAEMKATGFDRMQAIRSIQMRAAIAARRPRASQFAKTGDR